MSIEINSKKVQAKLENLANQLENSRPLFMAIAGALGSQTEANFEAQGRPAWAQPGPRRCSQKPNARFWTW